MQTTIESLGAAAEFSGFAKDIARNKWVRPNKRVFDNSKVSDHFAIIPTGVLPKSLSEPEQKIFDLVTRRFLAVFYPAAEFQVTTRMSTIGPHHFKTEGKILTNPGWMVVYGKDAASDDAVLVAVGASEKPNARLVESKPLKTRRPPDTARPRFCPPWRAQADLSMMMNCGRRWRARALEPRQHGRPSLKPAG